jgi:DNA-binding NarL/FixJ family response regulator
MELAFAGLHRLCVPVLDRLVALPDPQRDALRTTFGMSAGPVRDRFLVGLAVLSLLSEGAAQRPLICLIDDEQWLDRASAQMLAFVARRLTAESVGLVFGTRVVSVELADLPELVIRGLSHEDARALLDSVLSGPLDERVRDRIVDETGGNPLALLELPWGLTVTELAGGFRRPATMALSSTIEEGFRRRNDALPPESRRLLLLAAADPVGDPVLVWRAAGLLGIGAGAARPAADADLAEFGARVRFRHPLVRSAVYWSASAQDRQAVHRALAEVSDPRMDPDRRAWHRAQAAPGPDEQVAGELERSAGTAQARGGMAAASAFLEQAMLLTPDTSCRAQRALAAARAAHQAGTPDNALSLLDRAAVGPLSDFEYAQVELLRAQIALTVHRGGDTVSLLVKAAARLEAFDVRLTRETLLDALLAAMFAGDLTAGATVRDTAEAVRFGPPPPEPPTPADLLLDGLAIRFTDGYAAAVPLLKAALNAFGHPGLSADEMRWLWLAHIVAGNLWDEATLDTDRHVRLAREAGALATLPLALTSRMGAHVIMGDLDAATMLLDELEAVSEATGIPVAAYGAVLLTAWRGRGDELFKLIDLTIADLVRRGEGFGLIITGFANALFCNSVGRYEDAMAAARQASECPPMMGVEPWSVLVELIEAGTRSGQVHDPAEAFGRLAETTRVTGTDWGLGIEARCRALLSSDADAESAYQEAIERLGRTLIRGEYARAHLLYGEWLRRHDRRTQARKELRISHELFTAMGMEAFAERARRELRATGENVRKRSVDSPEQLTAQEAQVARLARDGLSNPEIGVRLFISARTVQYHLSKVFTKLGISSRSQLHRVLP